MIEATHESAETIINRSIRAIIEEDIAQLEESVGRLTNNSTEAISKVQSSINALIQNARISLDNCDKTEGCTEVKLRLFAAIVHTIRDSRNRIDELLDLNDESEEDLPIIT